MVKRFRYDDYNIEVEIGKVAKQANGAVWLKQGGTIILATATAATSKEFPGFFPLSVDYREYYSAAGKIPGGYFKREGKSSDREVLTSRLIDRALRPLFPEDYFDQVQILATVYSVDKEHVPNTVALLASSLALVVSDIPFIEPVGVIEVGRVQGEWIFNPGLTQKLESDVRLVIAGTHEGICMVEGSANELSEKEFLDVLFKAHEEIKKLVAWQETIRREIGKTKMALVDTYSWNTWCKYAEHFLTHERVEKAHIADKLARNTYLNVLLKEFNELHAQEITDKAIPATVIEYIFDVVLKDKLTEVTFELKERIDKRKSEEVRPVTVEVGVLPYTHGSSLFTRGRTQALVSVTLGDGQDAQRIESIMDDGTDGSFMLHYNFLPFSTGEVKPMRGPGRREVGHGHLAASAFDYLRPDKVTFPYTIRVVADIIECDGSSSMATACGATMALLQAGVPIKKMVAGIAMGMLQSRNGQFMILSDIAGVEDAFGLMDFKVLGTDDGIVAIQMDIKYKGGLPRAIFEMALEQARKGRASIMNTMKGVMSEPNKELSVLVPKVVTFKINTDKIGAVIGGGGKTIREIIENTGTKIDIEPDGLVKIYGDMNARLDLAVNWVKTLAGHIERGAIYEGKIRRIVEFGMFVELVPGLDGLVHISNIPRAHQKTFARDYKVDQVVRVEVLEYDEHSNRISLRIINNTTEAAASSETNRGTV